eukprot:5996431-Prymnesium_polylepis.1
MGVGAAEGIWAVVARGRARAEAAGAHEALKAISCVISRREPSGYEAVRPPPELSRKMPLPKAHRGGPRAPSPS